jgi:hypothetical protein
VRWFEQNEWLLTGPVTDRLGGDRQEIREVAEAHGWDTSPGNDKDVFTRNVFKVEVHYYEGDAAGSALRFRDGKQMTFEFTDPGAKPAALDWLASTQPGQD